MTPETAPCPICHTPAQKTECRQGGPNRDKCKFVCPRCGTYLIRENQMSQLESKPLSPKEAACVAGYRWENPHFNLITEADVEFLRRLRQPGIMERAMKLLRYIAEHTPSLGEDFSYPKTAFENDGGIMTFIGLVWNKAVPSFQQLLAASWSGAENEINFLLDKVLTSELEYLDAGGQITTKGWVAVEKAAEAEDPGLAFVAMSFDENFKPVYLSAIAPAIEAAGYHPEQMAFVEHVESITDKMMADIRRAKFLVVDLTEHRPNVYFEAGFAFGLGKPVIFLVQEDQKDDVHFDIQQYSYIPWSMDNLADLKNRLTQRILGPLGQGPIPVRPE